MKKFPIFLDLEERRTVIIGGGIAALRKARLVIAAGGHPTLIWSTIEPSVSSELRGRAELLVVEPVQADLVGAAIVFVTVEDDGDAARWAREARRAGALVNVVDRPALCDFTTPSIIDRGRLTIAISTDGAGPVFGKALREKIEALAPARADALLEFADRYRGDVKARIGEAARRNFWERFFNSAIAADVLGGRIDAAHIAMRRFIDDAGSIEKRDGVVHIVGAGPGDPELLTLRALRLIQSADVILHDRLVSDDILNFARRDADRIFVGKAKANHAVPQRDIEALMVRLAREGKTVVRLKGGDPFVFGRGGEELDAMRAAGVAAFVTPGITAAAGCAAATGMALTHRDISQAVTFITGHASGDNEPDLDWASLAASGNTLVVYMGVANAGLIATRLVENGLAAATPVAIVENGTRPDQKIVKGRLGDLGTLVRTAHIEGPALLVIGEIAARADGAGLIELASEYRSAA